MMHLHSPQKPRPQRLAQAIRQVLKTPRPILRYTGGALTLGLAGLAYAAFAPSFELSSLDGNNGFTINGLVGNFFNGSPVSNAGDINGDGIDDILIGAPRASTNGQSYVVFGHDTDFLASLELSSLDGVNGFALNGIAASDQSGSSVSEAGDINGDGLDDLIIGAPGASPNGKSGAGQSYVVFGTTTDFPAALELSSLDGTNGFVLNGISAYDLSGFSVSGAGDIDQDGIDDLIIGAPGADPNGTNSAGQSYVLFGRTTNFPAAIELSTLDGSNGFILNGIAEYDNLGYSVSEAGDVNGDGLDDMIIGAPNVYYSLRSSHAYLVFGRTSSFEPILEVSSLDGTNGCVVASSGDDASGRVVSGAGDINGDGLDDLLIGRHWYNQASTVVFGSDQGCGANGSFELSTTAAGFSTQHALSAAGDINGDGIDDILIGDYRIGQNSAGQSYVLFGRTTGFPSYLDLTSLDGTDGFALNGIADSYDNSGFHVSAAGDINHDGIDDILIGARTRDYVVFGSSTNSEALTVAIDILPGRVPKCVRIDGRGTIPVAILGSPEVRAANINPASLTFAGLDVFFRSGKPACQLKSVNGDPYPDLVCQFVDNKAKFKSENGTATLTGQLRDNTAIQGTDKICLLKPKPR